MAGKDLNFNVCSPLKLRSGLTENYQAICHYSYTNTLALIFTAVTYKLIYRLVSINLFFKKIYDNFSSRCKWGNRKTAN